MATADLGNLLGAAIKAERSRLVVSRDRGIERYGSRYEGVILPIETSVKPPTPTEAP